MKRLNRFSETVLIASLVLAMTGLATVAYAADPITVTVAVTGTPTPGATVTAKATAKTTDGSTVTGYTWKQVGGPTATVTGANTDTITIVMPDRKAWRNNVITVLEEAPIPAASYPPYITPPAEFTGGGLQNRWDVVGASNHGLADGAMLKFDVTVATSGGTYHSAQNVSAALPWFTATGIRNVAINVPVLLHGKDQATYNWTLTVPNGSKAALVDATTQNPEFTPDVAGTYTVAATETATNKAVSFKVYAGTWRGIITGQDSKGRPTVETACTNCHVGNLEMFTPWKNSGHAEILTQNVNTPGASHYGEACWECHAVGYTGSALKNGGLADQADFAGLEKDYGHMTQGDAGNWTKILASYPASAKLTNIQCENCHGPQNSDGHGTRSNRISLSSDVCGSCHGEPARHGRFQQWQISGHGNFETAVAEGTNAGCAACHSAQGFLQWGDKGYDPAAVITVTWDADTVQPQTCVACHDPHAEGTTSGNADTNATVRVSGNAPMTMAGYSASNIGRGATCIMCHNGRRGLRNDTNFALSDATRAPHEGPQGDLIMGQNMYFVKTGTRSYHSMIADTCVNCHMEQTAPPAALSLPGVGTNHAFSASTTICSKCHSSITAEQVQSQTKSKLAALKANIESAILAGMQTQIRFGNAIDLGGLKTVKYAADLKSVEFISSHGRQGVNVTMADNTKVSDLSLQSVKVVRPAGGSVELYATMDPNIGKAGWNYMMVEADKSEGVHNPSFVYTALDVANFAAQSIAVAYTTPPATSAVPPSIGGGLGNGAGAVTCSTKYVYWAEIAGHMPGNAGSNWRTDLIARNLGGKDANVNFILHQADGTTLTGKGTVAATGQKAFEDIVATLGGGNNMGALEVCSDQPLLTQGRIFNAATGGTFGQNLEGRVADNGYAAGQTVNLIGLRQNVDTWRSNISVTNAGKTEAQVSVSLFDSTGLPLKTYTLTIPAGTVLQDNEPLKARANTPDVGWAYATLTFTKGSNIYTSASLIDGKTNDPTTILAKQ